MYILVKTTIVKKYEGLNVRPETFDKITFVQNHLKPKPTFLDLIDYIIDVFIVSKAIPYTKQEVQVES